MPRVIIDGQEIEIREGERLNAIQAAKRAGIEIPHYCWHAGLSVVGSCRMCLVEVGARDPKTGRISMLPKLAPACNTPAKDGTVIVTNSQAVRDARARVEEGLLLRHPIDCPICDKAGECLLQDYHFKYGQPERRADLRPFTSRRRDLGDVTLFVDRCILCSRCVRFTREISGTSELMITQRGAHEEIDVVAGFPLRNHLSGNVVDLCPVGALGDKDFLYKQRVWFMDRHPSVCTECATGCSIWVEENQDTIYRIKPRENPFINQWWICNFGRYGYHHVHDERRLLGARRREGGSTVELLWSSLVEELNVRLREAGRLAAVLSPFLTVEEAWLLASYVRRIDPQAAIALGPVPQAGQEERFPSGFTISAEKCPNRRGVEEIVAHFSGEVWTFDKLLEQLPHSPVRGLWFSGGYRPGSLDRIRPERWASLEVLVVEDLFPSPLSRRATYELAGGAFAEREGSYVNRKHRLQSVSWAIRPPSGVLPEGPLYWQLLGRTGLYNARSVLSEVARDVLYFQAASGPIGPVGLDLKVGQLAGTVATPNPTIT
jgi:NADH-quinone oxidoreductase subunit G